MTYLLINTLTVYLKFLICRYFLLKSFLPLFSGLLGEGPIPLNQRKEKNEETMDFNFGSEGSAKQFDLPYKTPNVQFDFMDTSKVADYHRN